MGRGRKNNFSAAVTGSANMPLLSLWQLKKKQNLTGPILRRAINLYHLR